MLAVVSGPGAVERIARATARREMRLGQGRGGADEEPVGELELGKDVGRLHARFPLDESRVPRIEVIIRAGRVGRLSLRDVPQGLDHRLVPAGDVDQDLADAPAAEPHAPHLFVAQTVHRLAQLGECFLRLPQHRALHVFLPTG
jgi:hypothetical protein